MGKKRDLRLGRVVLVGVGVFVLSFILVTLVISGYAVFLGFQARGAPDQAEIQRFANQVAPWLGPVTGSLLTFIGAFWTARRVPERKVLHGLLVGVVAGLLVLGVGALGSIGLSDLIAVGSPIAVGWLGGLAGAGSAKGS